MIRWPVQSPCSWYMLRKHNDNTRYTLRTNIVNDTWKLGSLSLSRTPGRQKLRHDGQNTMVTMVVLVAQDYSDSDSGPMRRRTGSYHGDQTGPLFVGQRTFQLKVGGAPLVYEGPYLPPLPSHPQLHHQTRNVVHPEKFPAFPLFTRRLLKRSLFTRKNWKNCTQNTQHCTDCTNCTFAHLTIAQIALKTIEISDSNHYSLSKWPITTISSPFSITFHSLFSLNSRIAIALILKIRLQPTIQCSWKRMYLLRLRHV